MSKTSRSPGNRRVKWLVIQGDSYEIYVNRTLSYFVFTFGWDRIEQNGDINYKTHPERHCPTRSLGNVPCGKLWKVPDFEFLISELDDWSCNLFQANPALCCPKLVVSGIKTYRRKQKESVFSTMSRVFFESDRPFTGQPVGRKNRWNTKREMRLATHKPWSFFQVTWIIKAYEDLHYLWTFCWKFLKCQLMSDPGTSQSRSERPRDEFQSAIGILLVFCCCVCVKPR